MHSSVCAPARKNRPMPRSASTASRSVSSKASLYSLDTSGSASRRAKLGHILPAVAAPREFLALVLHPDDVDTGAPGLVHERGDGRDDVVRR